MKDFWTWERLSFHMVLAYNDDRSFLINTGMPLDLTLRNQEMKKFAGDRAIFRSEDSIEMLRKAGFTPDDIDYVALTPVQDYTIGRLNEFRKSKIFIFRDGWIKDIAAPAYAYFHNRDLFIPKNIFDFVYGEGWKNIIFYDGETELVPGIRAIPVGCHHRSSVAFAINAKDGTYVFTDASFKAENVRNRIPIGIAENIYECLSAYEKIEKIGKLLPAYDPAIDDLYIK
ncbi:hypothetical protein [Thermoplasma acidophilum]|uniref:Metallo-beta-lactamase domain-containing protein n=2 Tax=Thermoplasma acidophilum TaxID=2303 RepID=Q9HK54_THEAC|nr:hypothetical protein [Thermoplasma acidophilum]